MYEVAIGTGIGEVIAHGGGPAAPPQALLIGGYFGTWVDYARAVALPLSDAGLRPVGARVGAGLIAALPADACGLAETASGLRTFDGEVDQHVRGWCTGAEGQTGVLPVPPRRRR